MMTRTTKLLQRFTFLFALVIFLVGVTEWQEAIAAPVTYISEYTHQAGDADSKLTCRTIAFEQVKRLLLEQLGTYLVSNTEVKNAVLTKDEIVTYTGGAVATVIIEERWNHEDYYMKAKITADADEVAKSVAALHDDHEKAAELVQLRAQASESLKEIDRLNKELSTAKLSSKPGNTANVASVQKNYNQAVAQLTAKDYLVEGIRLRKTGTFEESIDAFSKAIESAPDWFRPYVTRGATFLLINDPQKAMGDLEQALKLNPTDITAGNLHGIVFLKLGRKKDGLSELKRVASASPNDFNMHTNIGGVLIKNNMHNDALPFLTHSINLRPNDKGRTYYLRAQVYNQIGKKQKALEDLRMAAQQGDPKALELLK
jgi:tetratricopeptide (TPR) repeat protein